MIPDNISPTIYETDRLSLKVLTRDYLDYSNYQSWLNDQEVCQFNSHGVFPTSKESILNFIQAQERQQSQIVWAVIFKKEKIHIGNISIQQIDWRNRSAEFAILMGEKNYWGMGLSVEASLLLIRHSFNKLNLNRIYCGTAEHNLGMIKLAKSLGMKSEGTRREALYLNGKYVNLIEFGILKNEFTS